jgi:hypothetical protein
MQQRWNTTSIIDSVSAPFQKRQSFIWVPTSSADGCSIKSRAFSYNQANDLVDTMLVIFLSSVFVK